MISVIAWKIQPAPNIGTENLENLHYVLYAILIYIDGMDDSPGNNGMEILRGSVIEILKSLDIGISDKMSLRESREKPQQLRKVYHKRF